MQNKPFTASAFLPVAAFLFSLTSLPVRADGAASTSATAPTQEVGGHWTSDSVTVEIVVPADADGLGVSATDIMQATEAAAETWNETGAGPQLVIVPAGARELGGFAMDGHNTLSFVSQSWGFDHRFAGLTRRALRGEVIVETDSILNASDWSFACGSEAEKIDLQSVVTHELGHVLGLLDDDQDTDATMFYGSRGGDVSKRTLASHDLTALADAYRGVTLSPTAAGAAGCSTSGGAPSVPFVAAVAFFVFVRMKRARARRVKAIA